MQSVVRQNEPGALVIGQPVFHEREIEIGIAAIDLIAHDGMAEVREVQADLMFAAGERANAKEREWQLSHLTPALSPGGDGEIVPAAG